MRMHQIEVDDEVFSYLQRKAQPFLDTPNTVLRRELPLRQSNCASGSTSLGTEKTLDLLPIPAGTPKALREILEVVHQVRTADSTRSEATNYVARRLGVKYTTIIDKYTRQLGLTASQFDRLLDCDHLPQLRSLLKERFRAHDDVVDDFLPDSLIVPVASRQVSGDPMSSPKFDNVDRERVIRIVENHFGVELFQVGRRSKWRQDASGRNYWILGGHGDWHGIPEKMMNDELASSNPGFLVVAVRKKSSMEVYCTGLCEFVAGRANLYRAAQTTGDYQFHYKCRGGQLSIKQLPNVSLERIETFDYTTDDKETDRTVSELKKLLAAMSDAERAQVLASLPQDET